MNDETRHQSSAPVSARVLLALAREFGDRAQAAEAELIAAFDARAGVLVADVGPIVLDDDDDEQLVLRADGVLAGAVLDAESGGWVPIETPEEIVRYYDPTDVFLDLEVALLERYPDLEDEEGDGDDAAAVDALERAAADRRPGNVSDGGPFEAAPPTESATLTLLRDLRRSGALSDEAFERLRRDLQAE